MEPEKTLIEHVAGQPLYSVRIMKTVHYAETHWERERSENKLESQSYALGNLEDIKAYFELKHPDKLVEVEKVRLNYKYKAMKITPELGEKARELKDLEKKVQEESKNI